MTFENSTHKVSLTGDEISTLLYALEGYIQGNDEYNEGGDLAQDIDNIFVALEIVADNWKGEYDEPKVTITPQQLEGDISTVKDSDYADKVDTLVGNMVASDDNVFTHDSEGC